jgi:hypothetical protein
MLSFRREPTFYRPTFYRHLHNLTINGFYARELDADDHAFLERVKVRGIANGDLPNVNTVLVEELDFWHLPYTVDRSIKRRAGPVPLRVGETPERREARLRSTAEWHKRRAERERDNAIAAAELAREKREWEEAEVRRRVRLAVSDAEWKAAAPRKFGKVEKRHYVPQWKIDEAGCLDAEVAVLDVAVLPDKISESDPPWMPKDYAPTDFDGRDFDGLKRRIKLLVMANGRSSIGQLMRWTRCNNPELVAELLEEVEEFALRYGAAKENA